LKGLRPFKLPLINDPLMSFGLSWVTVLKSSRSIAIVPKNEYRTTIKSAMNELHLRRLTRDEALLKLDQYLNDAFMAGLYQVKVIHGKGTGTLRQVVREQLTSHPLVKSFRPADYGEGSAGVTIVELAQK